MLPKEDPAWQIVSASFRRLCADGTWQQIHDTLPASARRQAGRRMHPPAGALDSQSVKTVQRAGAWRHRRENVKGRTRHPLVDTPGLLLAICVIATSVSDPAGARILFTRLPGC
jgi:putative transposase